MINNIPKNWELKTLGEVCESISAGGDKPNNITAIKTQENKIPIYANGISNDGLLGYTDTATIKKPAVTISARGTIGFVCVRYEPYFPVVRLISAIPNENILNLEFLRYTLEFFIPKGEGSSIPQLTIPTFKQIKIPLPPLATQKAIVEKLENAFAHIDEAVRHLKVVQTNIPRLKSSLLHCAFSSKLTESPLCHSEGEARRISKDSTLRDISGFALNMTNGGVCHSKPLADEESKPSCHTEPLGEVSYKSNKDISLVSQAQYDTIALTQNQIAFSKYPAFIYIVSNKNNTTLYIGVTSNLQKRIYEHKNHLHKGFSDKYNCEKLVYFESFDNINQAIEREKYLKGKKRAFKENLINAINPKWLDLYGYLFGDISHFSNAQYDKATCHSEALGEVSQEIFRCAQNDKGDNLPQGWEVKTLGEVCEFVYGKALNQTKRKTNGKYPVYAANGIKDYSDEFMISENSIIVGRKGSVGSIVLTSSPCWVLDVAYYVNFDKEKYNLVFLYHLLKYLNLKQFARGVKPGISRSQIYELQVVMPPLATQKQIVQILESKFAHLEKLAQFVNASLENLQRLKSSLLNQAFKGELVC